jgi:hypothetical protein
VEDSLGTGKEEEVEGGEPWIFRIALVVAGTVELRGQLEPGKSRFRDHSDCAANLTMARSKS